MLKVKEIKQWKNEQLAICTNLHLKIHFKLKKHSARGGKKSVETVNRILSAVRCVFVSLIKSVPVEQARRRCWHYVLSSWGGKNSPLLLLLPPPLLLQNRLFPAWLGTERVTGQGVYWNTVFSSAASAVQLQYSRNIVLLCGRSPRPAPFFVLNTSPSHQSVTILLRVSLPVSPRRPLPSLYYCGTFVRYGKS